MGKTFYHDAKSCISNNGYMSYFFPILRGVRQGCQLSTYLFIMCIELLSYKILTTEDIIEVLFIQNKNVKILYSPMMPHLYLMAHLNHFKH